MKIIEIHADSLEYTPDGLRTTDPYEVETGTHVRFVIIRPKRRDAVPVTLGAFAVDSSFPNPAVLMATLRPSFADIYGLLFEHPDGGAVYQIYGHASVSGDDAYNKALSDRRARVVAAVFTGEVEEVEAIAEQEGWSTIEHQVMLRVLRCDPGPIDGDAGKLTEAATRLFQQEYRDGVFHRHLELAPRNPQLIDDGVIGPATTAALIEAYVVACSPHVDASRMHPTHPAVGCSEFNRVSLERPELDRRVSLVVHPELAPYHDRAPCTRDDHSVCPLDNRDELARCPWYRAHVRDVVPEQVVHRHFDLRWLPLQSGVVVLSALTSLPDETPVAFQVFRSKPVSNASEIGPDRLDEPLSEELTGVVRAGVAQAVWKAPEGFDPFAVQEWLVPLPSTDPNALWSAPAQAQPPVFRVVGGGVEAISPPPGDDLGRVAAPGVADENGERPTSVMAIDAFGRFYGTDVQTGRPALHRHPLDPDEPRVVRVRYLDGVEADEEDDR